MFRRGNNSGGFSMPEMMVGITIAMIATTLVVYVAMSVYRTNNYSKQDSSVLGDLRTASERVIRELRQASLVYATSTSTTLDIWVDYDVDQVQDANERITWQIANSGGPTRAQISRRTAVAGSPTRVIARDLKWTAGFSYFTYNTNRSIVTITLVADKASALTPERTVRTQVRIRNASAL